MKTSRIPILPLLLLGSLFTTWIIHAQTSNKQKPMSELDKIPEKPAKIVKKTEADWKKKLTAEEYRIARQAGTEAPNGKIYKQFKKQGEGTYYCVACNAELFSSKSKFDSHSGWPSFYEPSKAKNVKLLLDADGHRAEIRCKVCNSHLGHVFTGEGFKTPTDKRYCVNGTVLKFLPKK